MTFPSPIHDTLENYEFDFDFNKEKTQRSGAATGEFHSKVLAEFIPWGEDGCFVLATTGIVELEYAAIQKSVGVFDAPCRGSIALTGENRLEFIDRMTTQKLIDMVEGEARLAFIVSRKGTLIADVIVRNLQDCILIDLEVTAAQQVCDHLQSYVVMDDVQIENKTDSLHWFWCVGPKASAIAIEGVATYTLPTELLGTPGIAIAVTPSAAHATWQQLVDSGARPIGWYALNIARVENAAAMFMIDFDTSNLPHETGLIESRVRFDKGCYLGQEIVARMESLGQPKRCLKQLALKEDDLPIAGSQIWEDSTGSGTPIGVVTSSAISPMSGGKPAVIVMLAKKFAADKTVVYTYVGTNLIEGQVSSLAPVIQREKA